MKREWSATFILGCVLSLAAANVSVLRAGPPPSQPDLIPIAVHLGLAGELTIKVTNRGTAEAPALPGGYVSLFVDGLRQANIDLPAIPCTEPDNTVELATGVFVDGEYRQLLVFVDSEDVHAEENELQNFMSLRIDVTWRQGADLSVDAEFDPSGLLTIRVTNVGNQASDPIPALTIGVDVEGTVNQVSTSLNALQPGEAANVPTTISAAEFDRITITLPFDSATDLDSTNNFVTRRHVTMDSIDPDLPGTPYYDLLSNNQPIREAMKLYPLCGSAICPCPNDDCAGIAYDDWSGEWAFLKDGRSGVPGLKATLLRLEQGRPLPFSNSVPARISDAYCYHCDYISEDDGILVYLNHLATTLWFDVRKNSLHGITDSDWNLAHVATLLTPEDLEWQVPLASSSRLARHTLDDGTPCFRYGARHNRADPTIMYRFMNALDMIGPTKEDTAWAVIDWTRTYGSHDANLAYGSDEAELGWHALYPQASYPRYSCNPLGGCWTAAPFVAGMLGPLGIPVAGQSVLLHSPPVDCPSGHARFALPSITKPGAPPGDVGVYVHHADDVNFGYSSWGYTPDPSYELFFTTEEARCQLGLDYEDCPCECESGCLSCDLNPLCDASAPECICDPGNPSCDASEQVIEIHPCAMQGSYNHKRHKMLKGKEYLTGEWLYRYYQCACLYDANCDEVVYGTPPECAQNPGYWAELYMLKEGSQITFAAPLLDEVERADFLAALDDLRYAFGWDVSQIWADILRRSYNRNGAMRYTVDCNDNGEDDLWDIFHDGTSVDCDGNGVPDECQDTSTDCNTNGVWDACDISAGSSPDCNVNGVPDGCDIEAGTSADCNSDDVPDDCEFDCNGNDIADECDIASANSADCNGTGVPDECETDCNENGLADECDLASGTSPDCNSNAAPDECDIAGGESLDDLPADGDGIPDECQSDCNGNGAPDADDLATGTSSDCNGNDVPDDCDTVGAFSNTSGALSPFSDSSEPQVHTFVDVPLSAVDVTLSFDARAYFVLGILEVRVLLNGTNVGPAFHGGGYLSCSDPAEQDQLVIPAAMFNSLISGGDAEVMMIPNWSGGGCDPPAWISVTLKYGSFDCNGNGVPDECDTAGGASADCDANLVPDECEGDCNANGIPDECDIDSGTSPDCNFNAIPDECDIADGVLDDFPPGGDGIPDECQADCNENSIPDASDISGGTSPDCNFNGVPDECEPLFTLTPEGSRYIALTPALCTPLAFRVTSPDVVCLFQYVQADGSLGDNPFYQLPEGWGVVHVHDQAIIPSTTYRVVALLQGSGESDPVEASTWVWGDVNNDGVANMADVQLATFAFQGHPSAPPLETAEQAPPLAAGTCGAPNGVVNFDDITAILFAFQGYPYPCLDPLPPPCGECTSDEGCDDLVACTIDTCVAFECVFTADNTACPDDGLFCNGHEVCNASAGCVSTGNPCRPLGMRCAEGTGCVLPDSPR